MRGITEYSFLFSAFVFIGFVGVMIALSSDYTSGQSLITGLPSNENLIAAAEECSNAIPIIGGIICALGSASTIFFNFMTSTNGIILAVILIPIILTMLYIYMRLIRGGG